MQRNGREAGVDGIAAVGRRACRAPARRRRPPDREPLPTEVRALMARVVVTPAHVDVLLALRRRAPRDCRLEDLATAASLPAEPVARRCMAELVRGGLASLSDASTYRYAPASQTLRESVSALAVAYRERRLLGLRARYGQTSLRRGGDGAAAARLR